MLAALVLLIAFGGYLGGRLIHADSFTVDAAWRTVTAFPVMHPERWGVHLATGLTAIIATVLGIAGSILGWRVARVVVPKLWRRFCNG